MTAEPGTAARGTGTTVPDTGEPGTAARGTGTTVPDTGEPGAAGPVRPRTWATGLGTGRRGVLLLAAGWAAAAAVLFFCYLRISATMAIESDGGADALQAWAILHGNPLLHGWHLPAVTFYTLDLPEYVLIELARGLGADVIHVGAAATYTLLVLLAAMLARGTAAGRQAAVRMLIAAGILIAPELGSSVKTLLESPDHVGTAALVLATWLLVDRAPRRWYVPPAVALLLAAGVIADSTVMVTGVLPLVAVGVVRAYQARIMQGRPLGSVRRELTLAAAALAAAGAGRAGLALISAAGGFTMAPAGVNLVAFADLPHHVLDAVDALLLLFGADFTGRNLDVAAGFALLHLVGLGLAAWAACRAARRFFGEADLVSALLLAGLLLNLAAYLLGWRQAPREMVAVLPMSAVLAGRLLGPGLDRARMTPALAAVLAGYLASLGLAAAAPAAPDPGEQLGAWLAAHHLRYGLAGYWQADSVTVASHGQVAVRAVAGSPFLGRGTLLTDESWYDPRRHRASFVILAPGGLTEEPVLATFGPPRRVYSDGVYTVLVWSKNLLADLSR